MLSDRHLEELRAERRADYLAQERAQRSQERRALAVAERIAQADSYLNDVDLPNYGELVAALRALRTSGLLGRTLAHTDDTEAAQRLSTALLARLGDA